jgi:predicted phage tail protein
METKFGNGPTIRFGAIMTCLTNKRYGLGKYISRDGLDKWTLYEISKYCDTLVSDGEGGLEPRFSCNLIIASREDAYQSPERHDKRIFRAVNYYANGVIYTSQDAQKEPVLYSNSQIRM